MAKGKHVIFLGAGASMSSGYPSADALRLLISSNQVLKKRVERCLTNETLDKINTGQQTILGKINKWADARELFREGCFGSVDEFSKLIQRGKFRRLVPDLKKMMRLVLWLHNPEDADFLNSDYYPLIQRFFCSDESRLRDDLTIISFNYDTYLEFLLLRAFRARHAVAAESSEAPSSDVLNMHLNALSGGFDNVQELTWTGAPFKVLKLHGSLSFVKPTTSDAFGQSDFFGSLGWARFVNSVDKSQTSTPPVVFPWEVFTDEDEGELIETEQFCQDHPEEWPRKELHQLIAMLWCEAQKEISEAAKISFVGLSCHPYLRWGFKFLFSRKKDEFEAVVANTENQSIVQQFEDGSSVPFRAESTCGRFETLLITIVKDRFFRVQKGDVQKNRVRPVGSFRDFIWREV